MGKKKNLFGENEDEKPELSLNKDYATNYENWRRKEESNKTKARYGDLLNEENDDSSTSESEDELENEVLDSTFFQTLSCLKNNDPRIYDQNVKFFKPSNDEASSSGAKVTKKEKPMRIRDYERKMLLETGGQIDSDDEGMEDPRANSPTYVEEQRRLKESLKKFVNDNGSDEEDWGGMFKKREKTKEELAKEEDDYVQWLKGQKDKLSDGNMESELKPLKEYWDNPKLEAGEKFLRDYILNKKFINDDNNDYIPSYEEIVHDSDEGLSEDEENIRVQEEFETKYNYRYEEPDKEFIKRYPRTMENSVRKKDDRRKVKRAELKERKEEEKLQKKEELQRLKAFKRKEIEEKLEKLKEITGNTDLGFNDEDVEGDFDPDEHDKRMQQLFNDEFYHGEEGDQKPEFKDLDNDLEVENWDQWQGETYNESEYEPHCEDENFNMDCDYDPTTTKSHAEEMIENSGGRKKRKRKSKFAEAVSKKKPTFDPQDKTYEEYLDEYYKLDYEDIIDDIPCRFKYRKVVPNDFGLTIEEILSAKDKELNKWCSLKKATQIRPDNVEHYEVIAYKRKAAVPNIKRKVLPSLFTESNEEEENEFTKMRTSQSNHNLKSQKQNIISKKIETITSNSNENKSKNNPTNTTQENQPNNETSKSKNKKKGGNIEGNSNDMQPNTLNLEDKKKNKQKIVNGDGNKKEHIEIKKKKRKFVDMDNSEGNLGAKKFKKGKKDFKKKDVEVGISDARLKAYGIKPKKFKNKLKYGGEKKF